MAGHDSEEFIPVHILPYPSESGDILTPQTGISHTRTASDTTVSIHGVGPVNAVPFAMRLHEGYTVSGEYWQDRSLQGSSTLVNLFSPEWGFVEVHMHYVGVDPDNDRYLAIVGQATLQFQELKRAQTPAKSEPASIRYSRDDRRGTHHGGRVLYPVGN